MIQRFRDLSIRTKIFSIFLFVLPLVATFNFIYFPWQQKRQVTQAMQARAEGVAQMLGASVSHALAVGDFALINELFNQAKEDQNILYIAICDADGQPSVSFNPQQLPLPSVESFLDGRTIEDETALHTHAPLDMSGSRNDLIIGFSLEERDAAIDKIRITGFIVSCATLLFGLILSVYLSRLIINPLSILVDTIDDIGRTEDFARTIEKSGTDEVGRLVDAFGSMIDKLRARSVERKQAEETLRESEERFRSLVQTAGTVILFLDPSHRILEWNREAERVFGWRREEVLGKNYFELFLPPETTDGVASDLEKVMAGEPTRGYVNPVVARDGTEYMLQWNIARLLDAGKPVGVIACGLDITEHQRLEEQLRQAQKMEAVGQLASGLAHNFNNMLMAIMGDLDQSLLEAPNSQKRILNEAIDSVERAADLVHQLMLFGGQDSRPISKDPVDLPSVLEDTMDICRKTFDRRISIAMDAPDQSVEVLADAGQLQQAFLNFCLNARDALEAGDYRDPAIKISIDLLRHEGTGNVPDVAPGSYVRTRISDNGVGMDAESRERAFEPFYTTKEVGKGTGLGLATAYAVVQQHQGWIECESEPGAGTTFSVNLPVAKPEAANKAAGTDEPALKGGTETILVIDDEAPIRKGMDATLSSFGYTVLLGADGADGTKYFGVTEMRSTWSFWICLCPICPATKLCPSCAV